MDILMIEFSYDPVFSNSSSWTIHRTHYFYNAWWASFSA